MSRTNTTHIRIYPDNKLFLKSIENDLSKIEGKKVTIPEILRRMTRIQRLPEVLKEDSLLFKRRKLRL